MLLDVLRNTVLLSQELSERRRRKQEILRHLVVFQRKMAFRPTYFGKACKAGDFFKTLSRGSVFARASQHSKGQRIRERRRRERKNLKILPKVYTKITQIRPKVGPIFELFPPTHTLQTSERASQHYTL